MLDSGIEETIVEESNTFSKFDLKDYTEIIYEGKSGHGDVKAVTNMMKDAESKGLIKIKDTKKGWMLFSTQNPQMKETIDRGERALHYLRRFLQKVGYK
jgi:Ribonuclease G/E